MLKSLHEANLLSSEYNICVQDILLIALNSCGIQTQMGSSRLRFKIQLNDFHEDEFRLILAHGRPNSPFVLKNDIIHLGNDPIAVVRDYETDNAVLAYFRRNGTVITLNSNSRSHCTGCVFCPNTLEGSSDSKADSLEDIVQTFELLAHTQNMQDLSAVVEVNLSTGCFGNEQNAIEHLAVIRDALYKVNSNAQIGILSSVIRSSEGFNQLANEIGNFKLILTIECFSHRETILKKSKSSLTPPQMPEVLRAAKASGLCTSFTYIVGFDEMDVAKTNIEKLVPFLTHFPNFQVYQPHNPIMDQFAAKESKNLIYYLKMRKMLESLFRETEMRPKSWENYRPLWYFEFANERMLSIRS